MGRLENRLLDHAVHQQLGDVRAALNSLTGEARYLADITAPEGTVSRAHGALDYVEGLLAAADPALVWQSMLDALLNQLSQMQSYASQLPASPEQVGPLDQAVDGLVSVAATQLAGAVRITARTASKINARLGGSLTTTVRELRSEVSRLEEEAAAVPSRIRESSTKAMAEEEQRRLEIGARLEELRTAVTAEKTRLDNLVPTYEQQFTAAQTAREQQHDSSLATFNTRAEEVIERVSEEAEKASEGLSKQSETLLKKTTQSINSVLADVREKREHVDELYGVITNTGTASAFRDDAEQQKSQANRWRWIAVLFAVLAAGAAAWAALSAAHDADDSTHALIARLALGAAAGGIAAYAARQSGRHRQREEDARRLELELTAFGPFIESLPEDAQTEARREFLDRIFVGRTPAAGGALTEESIGLMQSVVDVVMKASRVRVPPG
jgi:hypothetical protein